MGIKRGESFPQTGGSVTERRDEREEGKDSGGSGEVRYFLSDRDVEAELEGWEVARDWDWARRGRTRVR